MARKLADIRHLDTEALARKKTLVEQAYETIRYRIITTAYSPGAELNEAQVSLDTGFGRTPINQALHRLEQERFVDIRPRKGAWVRPISPDEIAEIIEVRLLLEPYSTAQAAASVKQDKLEEPRRILKRAQEELDNQARTEVLMQLDGAFHSWINWISGNRALSETLKQFQDRSARFWFHSLSNPDHARQVHEEHKCIFQAICARDREESFEAAKSHIKSFRSVILNYV